MRRVVWKTEIRFIYNPLERTAFFNIQMDLTELERVLRNLTGNNEKIISEFVVYLLKLLEEAKDKVRFHFERNGLI